MCMCKMNKYDKILTKFKEHFNQRPKTITKTENCVNVMQSTDRNMYFINLIYIKLLFINKGFYTLYLFILNIC